MVNLFSPPTLEELTQRKADRINNCTHHFALYNSRKTQEPFVRCDECGIRAEGITPEIIQMYIRLGPWRGNWYSEDV